MSEFRRAVTIIENVDNGFKVVATADESETIIDPETVIKMMHRAIDLYSGVHLASGEGTE